MIVYLEEKEKKRKGEFDGKREKEKRRKGEEIITYKRSNFKKLI